MGAGTGTGGGDRGRDRDRRRGGGNLDCLGACDYGSSEGGSVDREVDFRPLYTYAQSCHRGCD